MTLVESRAVTKDLGSDNDRVAPSAALGEPATDDLFGAAAIFQTGAVGIGGVEEVNAHIKGFVHHAETVLLAYLTCEIHRAQTQTRDLHACSTQKRVLHHQFPYLSTSKSRPTRSKLYAKGVPFEKRKTMARHAEFAGITSKLRPDGGVIDGLVCRSIGYKVKWKSRSKE